MFDENGIAFVSKYVDKLLIFKALYFIYFEILQPLIQHADK